MNFLTDKKGNLSWLRVSILIAVLGVFFLGGSIVAFFVDQSTRNSPLMIDVPPGAQQWGNDAILSATRKQIYYRIPGDNVDVVAEFYQTRMRTFYGGVPGEEAIESCLRLPPAGFYTDKTNEPGGVYDPTFVRGEILPVVWKCLFDGSGLNSFRTTEVWIYAGLPNSDPIRDASGYVVIRHEQLWDS